MSGAGNDFILFDAKINPKLDFSKDKIAQICDRRNGIGADGILIIYRADGFDFEMKYYNADGSFGTLCGNGARCSLLYAKLNGLLSATKSRFLFSGKVFSGEICEDGNVKFNLSPPLKTKLNFKIKVAGQLVNACFADTGSPHIIIRIEDVLKNPLDLSSSYNRIDDFPVYDIGKEIRFHNDFMPEGVNVNFIQVINDKVKIRTYERGVENETLSCGTGSVASAVILFNNKLVKKPVEILAKSGEQLLVDFEFDGRFFSNVSLTGPAKIVYNGEITT